MIIKEDTRHRYILYKFGIDNGLLRDLNPPYETLAVSLSQARNNFRHRIANDMGMNRSDILIFDDFIFDSDAEEDGDEVVDTHNEREVCMDCGTMLDDSGYCPVCDYGEEDY